MEDDTDILAVASATIARFGADAEAVVEGRAEEHLRAGEREGAEFWRNVANAIREMGV
jgi:hypothetical protein